MGNGGAKGEKVIVSYDTSMVIKLKAWHGPGPVSRPESVSGHVLEQKAIIQTVVNSLTYTQTHTQIHT